VDTGIPQYLQTPAGTLFFNVYPDDDLFMVQEIHGLDMPEIRNPIDNRPQRDGGILHPFFRGKRVFTIGGLIIASSPEAMTQLQDDLRGFTDSITNSDGIYGWVPPGQSTRVMIVRLYEAVEIGPHTPGSVRTFQITLVSDSAMTYGEGDLPSTVEFFGHQDISKHGPVFAI
jgi:hypothetical protein